MIGSTARRSCLLLGFAAVASCAWWLSAAAQPEPPALAAPKVDETKAGKRLFFPSVECVVCHSKGMEGGVREDSTSDLTEGKVWQQDDKHRLAYLALQGPRAQEMGKRLGIDVTKERSCLACHGVWFDDAEVKDRSLNAKFKLEEGVSCAVCHGPYARWADQHHGLQNRAEWQKKTRDEKQTEAGMTDLWDPVRRTKVCASCHIGNTAEGKVVTHDMYVAGHPPLPGFEIASFCRQMPMHWKLMRDKSPAVQKLLGYKAGELEETRLVIEGGVASFREAMNLYATQAEHCAAQADKSNRLLDMANFDCYSCHHELRYPAWRMTRNNLGLAGRPPLRPWPTALLALAIRQAAPQDANRRQELWRSLQAKLQKLALAATEEPFGDAPSVAKAAKDLVQWSDDLLREIGRTQYDRAAALQALRELAAVKEVVDFDSARQIAWAFETIYAELPEKPAAAARIESVLKELRDSLQLALPAGQKTELLKELDRTLRQASQYSPTRFQASLKQLDALLAE
ncbi:MAG: hypothetical protein JNM56_30785 [Planctomycetia bacterium]|nr:hypothetical protein [Planctomycetia bacterium]